MSWWILSCVLVLSEPALAFAHSLLPYLQCGEFQHYLVLPDFLRAHCVWVQHLVSIDHLGLGHPPVLCTLALLCDLTCYYSCHHLRAPLMQEGLLIHLVLLTIAQAFFFWLAAFHFFFQLCTGLGNIYIFPQHHFLDGFNRLTHIQRTLFSCWHIASLKSLADSMILSAGVS